MLLLQSAPKDTCSRGLPSSSSRRTMATYSQHAWWAPFALLAAVCAGSASTDRTIDFWPWTRASLYEWRAVSGRLSIDRLIGLRKAIFPPHGSQSAIAHPEQERKKESRPSVRPSVRLSVRSFAHPRTPARFGSRTFTIIPRVVRTSRHHRSLGSHHCPHIVGWLHRPVVARRWQQPRCEIRLSSPAVIGISSWLPQLQQAVRVRANIRRTSHSPSSASPAPPSRYSGVGLMKERSRLCSESIRRSPKLL